MDSPWNSPGQNPGVGSLSILQGIFPTQGLNPGLPHCRWILYQLSHKGSLRILQWVVYLFSSRSSPPRNRTGVSCIAGRFFTSFLYQGSPIYMGSTIHFFRLDLFQTFSPKGQGSIIFNSVFPHCALQALFVELMTPKDNLFHSFRGKMPAITCNKG